MRSLSVCALLACCTLYAFASEQNITVKGTAVCNKKRLAGITIELKEKDTLTPDDVLSTVSTDKDGEFTLFGKDSEIFSIEPYIVIHHDCNVKKAGCHRVTKFEVPKSKIGSTYDMTYVTLDIQQYDDKEKC